MQAAGPAAGHLAETQPSRWHRANKINGVAAAALPMGVVRGRAGRNPAQPRNPVMCSASVAPLQVVVQHHMKQATKHLSDVGIRSHMICGAGALGLEPYSLPSPLYRMEAVVSSGGDLMEAQTAALVKPTASLLCIV